MAFRASPQMLTFYGRSQMHDLRSKREMPAKAPRKLLQRHSPPAGVHGSGMEFCFLRCPGGLRRLAQCGVEGTRSSLPVECTGHSADICHNMDYATLLLRLKQLFSKGNP